MTRPYHSPSSIALGLRCQRAWAERYVRGVRDVDVPWSAFEGATWQDGGWLLTDGTRASVKTRATALGKAVHAVFESWHKGLPADWRGLPGEIALSGAHLVPHPARVTRAITEGPIGREPLPPNARADITHGLRVHGVMWAGFRDLLAWPTDEERARLAIGGPLVLVDYKSTANVDAYALTPEQLRDDPQANLYAIDTQELTGERNVPAHWVYLETKARRYAQATRTVLDAVRAQDVIGPCAELAQALDLIERVEDAPQNPAACSDYGPPGKINCPHHVVNGGACKPPRRSIGGLVQARVKKEANMSLSPEAQAKIDALKAKKAAAGTPAPEAPQDAAPEPEAQDTPEQTAPTPAPKPAVAPKPRKSTASDGSAAASVIALSAELASAKADADKATARVGEIMAAIAKAAVS